MTGSQKSLKMMSIVALALGAVALIVGVIITVSKVPPAQGNGVLLVIAGVSLLILGLFGMRAGADAKNLKFFLGCAIIIALFQFFGVFIGLTASLTHMESVNGLWSTLDWAKGWDSLDWGELVGLVISIICIVLANKARKELAE